MDIAIEYKDEKTLLKLRDLEQRFPERVALGMYRAVEHLRGMIDRNLALGTFKIKTDTGMLRDSLATHVRAAGENIQGVVGSNIVYAKIQETGGTIRVTDSMAGYAWNKYNETGDTMWKAIALKRGKTITIPAHWYMRQTLKQEKAEVLRLIENAILNGFDK